MSIESHIVHLETKHAELDHLLAQEMARPSPDFFVIKDAKKQKLLLKEEITRLENETVRQRKDAS